MKVFLIGFMGCGKSTKAKQLAHRLECPVIDLDAEIVTKSGKTIAEYFEAYGEQGFRNFETEMLKNLSVSGNLCDSNRRRFALLF